MTKRALSVRPYEDGDQEAVLGLIADDRPVGGPEATAAMLADAVAGRPPAATEAAALRDVRTQVAEDADGAVLGAVCHGTRPGDGDGHLAWLHVREELDVAEAILEAVLPRFARHTVHAFALPTALSPWAPGLAVRSRPATRTALERAGFSPDTRWRYLHRPLPPGAEVGEVRTYPIAEVTRRERPDGWDLDLREPDGALIGHAIVSKPVDGVSALRWIAVDPERRGRGLGRALAEQAVRLLAHTGARELVTLLEEEQPSDSRAYNPVAADHLLHALGFAEIGPLWSFTRRP